MASNKTEKTWDDLQESFNRIRQQLGLVPWTHQSDRPKSQLVRQKVHSPSYLPRLVVTSDAISKRPVADLRRDHWVVVPPLYNNSLNKEDAPSKSMHSNFQQPISHLKFSPSPDVVIVSSTDHPLQNTSLRRREEDYKVSTRTWNPSSGFERELTAYYPFKENLAWYFVDAIILEVIQDKLVPDILMELLLNDNTKHQPVYAQRVKKSHIQNELRIDQLGAFKPRPAVSILETLLEEEICDLTRGLIRNVFEEFANVHLTSIIISEFLTELIEETIIPILPQIVRTYAGKRLIDMFLLEIMLKALGNEGRAFSEEVELDRMLDSSMLDILLDQYLNISHSNCTTIDNVALKDYHVKAFTDVALNVILTEMSEHMDEDMADLFEYERQVETSLKSNEVG
ncbi:uncharacterized protein LOC129712367 isoform X2 [Leucoraja erinacea]|uniref:uncharacterized protein LOC129712367 isoform X2 n=1 Tax=Leucoraja erinaceus TaxID=7782 RepID=UPI0024556B4A|nr:uncharacterized protein LOC129712367 isoform X2 [Leucoraja erinacea]